MKDIQAQWAKRRKEIRLKYMLKAIPLFIKKWAPAKAT
jgi:hypothetical protein